MSFPSLIRSKTEHKVVYPADVILFEGILALYSPELRNLMQMKIFVDTDSDTRLARRSGCGLVCRHGDHVFV